MYEDCTPVEDIISIEYSTDIKKECETFEIIRERAQPSPPKLKSCGQVKQCLRKTFCCCPSCPCKKCKPSPEERPQFDTNTTQNVIAKRMILIEMKCIQHSNIDIPTHVQVLPNDEKAKFYTNNFKIDDHIQFYAVNNDEAEQNNFEAKRNQAENFCRIIVQLRNMAIIVFSGFFFLINKNSVIFDLSLNKSTTRERKKSTGLPASCLMPRIVKKL
jgi:hypothetical protein